MQKILLIEDSRIVKIVHERALTRAGYEVVSAADGEEALRLASSAAPDLVLLDMMLPKVSGPDVLRFLKKDPATARIPVIVLTALSRKNEDKLLLDGAAAFLGKSDLLESAEPLIMLVGRVLQEQKLPQPAKIPVDAAMAWTLNEIESSVPAHD